MKNESKIQKEDSKGRREEMGLTIWKSIIMEIR